MRYVDNYFTSYIILKYNILKIFRKVDEYVKEKEETQKETSEK